MKEIPTMIRKTPTPAEVRIRSFTESLSRAAESTTRLISSVSPFALSRADCAARALAAGINSRASNFQSPAMRKTMPKSMSANASESSTLSGEKNIQPPEYLKAAELPCR